MSITSTHWPIPPRDEPLERADDTPPPDSELPVKPGDVLSGRYAVERVLASGGMGVVCLGRHVELEQPVAIKFLRRELAQNRALVQRFLNEARAAASLRSEHVVRVMDVAELESGRPYLVMEHLDGEDLGALIERQGALPPERALGYVLDVCAALAEAHAAGIVHRDIKPENLILCTSSGREVVKVVDFGLAKRIDASHAKVVTDPREGMGSPCYMSPEQIATPHAVDARTDIWSLGVVLYRLVSGVLPFDGDSVTEVCARVLNASPRPLPHFRPELGSLDFIVRRCLEKNRELRFLSVDELATAIRRYRSAAFTDTQPTSHPPPVVHQTTSHPPPVVPPRHIPSDAPMALPAPAVSSRRFVAPFVASLVAFVAGGAALGSYAAGGVSRLREAAGAALSTGVTPNVVVDLTGHPRRQLVVSQVAPGVCAASPVRLRGGGVALPAEREVTRPDSEEDENKRDDASRDDPKAADSKKGAEPADAEDTIDAAEAARRERRYRRYLDRHGYKPIREVLEQIERPNPPGSVAPAEP
jgi:serine/threonine protein kinase